ncbi:hypothetical protein IV38_GL000370 [Lactobacillus selangorensis]|uniref:Uncharacterized protein n=1 Tax=Lactobacillus selangorensis TaxID=81857 RepID=A0A0R2FWZ3_9LACO|nr:hypothetical protein [Lactobacillus selangorensis]KRN29485.1 hypothetical protein IV38_GL000370 [Lactobacillus selangorensis]KRN33985.1 hypothetical protein IV40_GL000298 [Lactobacillus selangorensis]
MKNEKKERHAAIVDMNDFMMNYAATKFPKEKNDLAEKIYAAGKDDVKGLDTLFNDQGLGRKQNYLEIAEGFLVDFYGMSAEEAAAEAPKMAQEAMQELGSHTKDFDDWEK